MSFERKNKQSLNTFERMNFNFQFRSIISTESEILQLAQKYIGCFAISIFFN